MKTRSKVAIGAGLAAAMSIGIGIGVAWAQGQPHMQNALSDLQAARGELQAAATDKAGHRVAAIGLVNQAIVQVREGMAAGAI